MPDEPDLPEGVPPATQDIGLPTPTGPDMPPPPDLPPPPEDGPKPETAVKGG